MSQVEIVGVTNRAQERHRTARSLPIGSGDR
jgi:hypothetical protein